MINETPIGNATTFRPTEGEKLILLNIADMIEGGRSVTQQDAVNVPPEKLKDMDIGGDNLEAAYAQLVKIGMIQMRQGQTLALSPAAETVVQELKKAEDQEALTQQSDSGQGEQPQAPINGQEMDTIQQAAQGQPSMESFGLIRFLNDMSKLLG